MAFKMGRYHKSGMFSCHIWQLPASLKDAIAGKFWNDVQNLPDLVILLYSLKLKPKRYQCWQVLE